jgi:AhpD family alkylhydroperoxidase
MARIPYASLEATEARPLVDRIVAERGSVLHLYQMLLHSPPVAEGWLAYLTAIRQRCRLPGALRELVIIRIAGLNGAPYEADQHVPIARREGVSDAQLAALSDWQSSAAFGPVERCVLALTDAMTQSVKVPQAVLDEVHRHFDARETVELVATIAAYNMVSRFLVALDIHSDDARDGDG